MPRENNTISSLSAGEIETLKTVYGFVDPETVLACAAGEEKDQLIRVVSILREVDRVPTVKELYTEQPSREEIDRLKAHAIARAEEAGIEALTPEERGYYESYLLCHVNKTNARGEAVKPIHANIMDLVLCNDRVFVLNQDLYIYDAKTGTYCIDSDGRRIKGRIRSYLDREFIEDKTINAIYNLILSDSRLAVSYDRINNRPRHWIHFRNGYYDYKMDTIYPHDPGYYEIGVIPWDYLPSRFPVNYKFVKRGGGILRETTTEPLVFNAWLNHAIPDPEDQRMFFQYLAYGMTLETGAQKFLLICGPGGTGKSTLLKLIEEIVGKPNVSSVSLQGLQDRFAPAELFLKQANICADIPLTALSEVDMIKKLTGEDTISADRKFKSAYTFRSYARLFFSANDIPYIAEKTNAFYRRMLILKMDHAPETVDPELFDKLRAEIPHIITRAMEEIYCSGGEIDESENSKKAVQAARKDSDTIEAFLCDRCETGDKYRTDSAELFRLYQNYCTFEERKSVTRRTFYSELEKRGFERRRGKSNYDIVGVRLSNVIPFTPVVNAASG